MLLFNQLINKILLPFTRFQNISCYCLTRKIRLADNSIAISKHLMLLFNATILVFPEPFALFQNILCYCLTVIDNWHFCQLKIISKHLMLLFNIDPVCVYIDSSCISKHLMLLFNIDPVCVYIDSSCISKHLMLLFNIYFNEALMMKQYFKTSHVIV